MRLNLVNSRLVLNSLFNDFSDEFIASSYSNEVYYRLYLVLVFSAYV